MELVRGRSFLAALHAAGKLHRDIKPANVMVTNEGRVVLDFGLVSEIMDEPDSQLCGTPHHMSPEMAEGRPLTEQSDWYSVGVMLYEALTGTLPQPEGRCAVPPAQVS
jgi:serine/threonine protein kinase